MNVEKFTNKILSSNSYIIHSDFEENIWIVDPGESNQLLDWITKNNKIVVGIILTHTHIDHIYGVNDICNKFPDLLIYASEFALEGMFSAKVNGSYYMEMPYVITHNKIQFVNEISEICLFKDVILKILYTPGHNNDCISLYTDQYLFTGDALIPGVKPHTKSKNGNKKQASESIHRLLNKFDNNIIICSGHKEITFLNDLDIDNVLQPKFNSK